MTRHRIRPLLRIAPAAALAPLVILAFARVTHANAPAGRYVVSSPSDGTVYDTKTKLTWQQPLSASPLYSWGSPAAVGTAQNYCATLALAGSSGWRVPTVSELQTLVDYSKTGAVEDGGPSAMIDTTYFPNTPGDVFWSSTPYVGYSQFAWGVNFSFGNSNGYEMSPVKYVRCVR